MNTNYTRCKYLTLTLHSQAVAPNLVINKLSLILYNQSSRAHS